MTNPNDSSIHSKLVILFFQKVLNRALTPTLLKLKKNQNILYFFRENNVCLIDLRKFKHEKCREKILKKIFRIFLFLHDSIFAYEKIFDFFFAREKYLILF